MNSTHKHPHAAWWRAWPGPGAKPDAAVAWLEASPMGAGLVGPCNEYAWRQGAVTDPRWMVLSFSRGAMAPALDIVSSDPDRFFSSSALVKRWRTLGLGWHSVMPHIVVDDLHALLRGEI